MPVQPSPHRLRTLGVALFLSFAASAAAHAGEGDSDAAQDLVNMPVEALERAFWICDHRATTHGVDATPVGACTAVFEALKQNKFGGDFIELLAWWRENKLTEHTRLESH